MFNGTTRQRISRAERTIIIHEEFGHDEQRYAFDAVRCAGRFGQHQMNDVFGQVVFARRNEDFGARNRIAAIGIRHGLSADKAKIGSTMRFGQVHCPAPSARNHIRCIFGLLFVATLHQNRGNRTLS